jgi:hypothetical protein
MWFYLYIAVALVFVVGLWYIYSYFRNYWYGTQIEIVDSMLDEEFVREIFLYRAGQHHLLRTYAIESIESIESSDVTYDLLKDNLYQELRIWKKCLGLDNATKLSEFLTERLNLIIAIIADQSEVKKIRREIRSINRKIAELFEDEWGLQFDASGYLRETNEMYCNCYIHLILHICGEDYVSSKEDFQGVMACFYKTQTFFI